MAERSTIAQGVQIGVETTEGTLVPADKRLSALGITPSPDLTYNQFKAMGSKYTNVAVLGKEFTAVDLSGIGTYTEIVYPLSSVAQTAAITTPGGGTLSRLWTFTPATNAADTRKSFSVENGDGNFAEKFAGMVVTDFGIDITRDGVDISGSGFGKAIQTGATLTATPTTIALKPIVPTQVSVYMDPPGANQAASESALGTTKLTRVFEANFQIGGRFGPVWPLDAALNSYAATVELDPTTTLELTMEADAAGMGLFANARVGDVRMIRVEAVTTTFIETTIPWKFTLDIAGQISDGGDTDDLDGVKVVHWTFDVMNDSIWQHAWRIAVQNALTAL